MRSYRYIKKYLRDGGIQRFQAKATDSKLFDSLVDEIERFEVDVIKFYRTGSKWIDQNTRSVATAQKLAKRANDLYEDVKLFEGTGRGLSLKQAIEKMLGRKLNYPYVNEWLYDFKVRLDSIPGIILDAVRNVGLYSSREGQTIVMSSRDRAQSHAYIVAIDNALKNLKELIFGGSR